MLENDAQMILTYLMAVSTLCDKLPPDDISATFGI